MTILVRCSGWSYNDQVDRFYPIGLAKTKGVWLSNYAQFFNTLDINRTYYHPSGERQIQSCIKTAKENSESPDRPPIQIGRAHV